MSTFRHKLVAVAEHEIRTFGEFKETKSPLAERIGEFWTAVGRPDLDGTDTAVPWSAAFISFMVRLAGAGSAFPYSAQHSVYFYRTINDKTTGRRTSFWGFRPEDITIEPGDILGMNREGSPAIDYDWAEHHADYKSHADIVVGLSNGQFETIGGNVSNKVARKKFKKSGSALVNASASSQKVFVVIRSFLP